MFGQHPADALGIVDPGVRADVLLCAWRVLGDEVKAEGAAAALVKELLG
jgi:hypothetical protein